MKLDGHSYYLILEASPRSLDLVLVESLVVGKDHQIAIETTTWLLLGKAHTYGGGTAARYKLIKLHQSRARENLNLRE